RVDVLESPAAAHAANARLRTVDATKSGHLPVTLLRSASKRDGGAAPASAPPGLIPAVAAIQPECLGRRRVSVRPRRRDRAGTVGVTVAAERKLLDDAVARGSGQVGRFRLQQAGRGLHPGVFRQAPRHTLDLLVAFAARLGAERVPDREADQKRRLVAHASSSLVEMIYPPVRMATPGCVSRLTDSVVALT